MKVKVADCAPGYAKMTAAAEWFVQDDMPTIYYISEHPLDAELPKWERVKPQNPPCSPKLIVPPAEIPTSTLYFTARTGFKGAPTLEIRSEDLQLAQTANWIPPEEISMRKMEHRMARFALPGQPNELA